ISNLSRRCSIRVKRAIPNAVRRTTIRTEGGIAYTVIARAIGTKRGAADIVVGSPGLAMQISISLRHACDADKQCCEKCCVLHGVFPLWLPNVWLRGGL